MKQTILGLIALATITFGFANNTNAQDNQNREQRRTEMQARQTERLVKDLKLTDEQQTKFKEVYGRYQAELATQRPQQENVDAQTGASPQQQQSKDKKELTDAEATAQLQRYFTQQEQQLQRQQQRLDIQKKYCAEFSAFLTPQQLVKVFNQPAQRNRNNGAQQGQRGQRGGGFGGGQRGGFGGGPRGGGFGGDF